MIYAQNFRRSTALATAVVAVLGLGAVSAIANPPEISAREAAILRAQHHQIQHMRRVANADGEVTRREHARIKFQQQKLRHMIHRARNN
jgi:hypothetical protein